MNITSLTLSVHVSNIRKTQIIFDFIHHRLPYLIMAQFSSNELLHTHGTRQALKSTEFYNM